MGVIRWLDRIDPSVWERATTRIAREGTALLDRTAAAAFLRDFGKEPTDDTIGPLDDVEDDSVHPTLLNGLLEAVVTEATWELDKALDRFARIAGLLPDGQALKAIIDFKGIDVEVPEVCRMIESGLYGCCSAAALAGSVQLLRSFRSPSDVQAALRTYRSGFVGRLLGRSDGASAAELMSQDYYADYWQTLSTAVIETAERGHHLGLGMSP
jgi:hypothetical protein